jgi:chemotaxis protein methyltransferase CheR
VQIRDPDFQFLQRLVYDQSRIQLGDEKKEMVCTRLNNRLTHLGLSTVAEYCDLLKSNDEPGEVTHLIDALSTNFTTFFREIDHFRFLKEKIVAEYLETRSRRGTAPLRAWSAACSTGEEPYSMAIIMDSCFKGMDKQPWQIFASDISTRVLEKASRGIYEASRVKLPNPAWLPRYFQQGTGEWDDHYRVKQYLRERIDFQHMNLLDTNHPMEERYHFIFCRNVMIYFDRPTARTLAGKLCEQLHEGGYLIIGHAESLDRNPPGLKQLKSSIFKKVSK